MVLANAVGFDKGMAEEDVSLHPVLHCMLNKLYCESTYEHHNKPLRLIRDYYRGREIG